jgi:hypothetical protein
MSVIWEAILSTRNVTLIQGLCGLNGDGDVNLGCGGYADWVFELGSNRIGITSRIYVASGLGIGICRTRRRRCRLLCSSQHL